MKTLPFRLALIACTLWLAVPAPASAQDEDASGRSFKILAGAYCTYLDDLDLAPAPDGPRAVFREDSTWFLASVNPEGAHRDEWRALPEIPAGAFERVRIATALDGSGAVAWQTPGDEVYALFFNTEGEVVGSPLLLGTVPHDNLELTLRNVGGARYVVADETTSTAVLFEPGAVVGTLDLEREFDRQDFVRVGNTLWHAGARIIPPEELPIGVPPEVSQQGMLELRRYDFEGGTPLDGGALWGEFYTTPEAGDRPDVALGADGSGRVTLAWGSRSGLLLYRFDTPSADLLSTWDASDGTPVTGRVSLAVDAAGNQAVTWDSRVGFDPSIRLSTFLTDGTPVRRAVVVADPTTPFADAPVSSYEAPHVVLTGAGQIAVAFQASLDYAIAPVPVCAGERPGFGLLPEIPLGGDRRLLLQEGRFEVEVEWRDPHNGGSGVGHAVPGTSDAGSFWFFEPSNKEIEVKIIDGRTVNGHFWVFAAGLSDVGYTVRVVDQITGEEREYVNPPLEFGNFIDTAAFAVPGLSKADTPPPTPETLYLSTALSCDARDPVLAPTAEGFLTAWEQRATRYVRRFDADAAAVSLVPEATRGALDAATPLVDGAVATAPDGSALFVYRSEDGAVTGELFNPEGDRIDRIDLGLVPAGADLRVTAVAGGWVVTDSVTDGAARVAPNRAVTFFDLPESLGPRAVEGVGDVLWTASIAAPFDVDTGHPISVQPLSPAGTPLGARSTLVSEREVRELALAHDERDRIYVAWATRREVLMRVLGTGGEFQGDLIHLTPSDFENVEHLGAVSDPEGNVLVTWEMPSPFDPVQRVWATTRLAGGRVILHSPFVAEREAGGDLSDPAAVLGDGGVFTLAARLKSADATARLECPSAAEIVATRRSLAGDEMLLLQDGRFEVLVHFEVPPSPRVRTARAVPGTDESGSFWFFDPDNKEIEIKILDGTAINGHFWVFAAGLSNVDYSILLHDQRTGAHKVYTNESPDYGNFIDTSAFVANP